MTLKEKIGAGEPVLGMMISEFGLPNLVRIMQTAGFEYIIIDCEHGPFDLTQVAGMVAMGNAVGLPVLVRVPGIDRGFITKTLDMGADGFLVPMINTAEDAQRLVSYAKYAPIGHRGLSTTRAHTNYNPPKLSDYMESANRRTILLTQIETKEAVEHAAEIAAVPGIDALIVGPSDLSSDLGRPGDLSNPDLLEAASKVTEAAKQCGKRCGTVASNTKYLHACREMGMNLFCMGSELGMVLAGARSTVQRFQNEV